ncbi:MAG: serine/threonine-protein phosphatase [Burkholderiaceae bacterium]|nr:serine/threonine-protein phosphatase [Microbacteriaceae bacterium]
MTHIGQSAGRVQVNIPGRGGPGVVLAWGAATDIGRRRKLNEDSLLAVPPFFVVADGMGGHASGDVASSAVVTRLSQTGSGDFAEVDSIVGALRAATADITLAADDHELGVGTTATGAVLVLAENVPRWAVFNIGDSRVYEFDGETLERVTVDHSVVQELVDAGLLRPEEAEAHPDSNIITRAVGFNAEPIADVWLIPVRRGNRLLICSDGLTREVSDERLRDFLAEGLDAEETAATLIAAALAGGGRDNVTTVVVDVLDAPGENDPATPDDGVSSDAKVSTDTAEIDPVVP